MKNYYEELGVEKNADISEIKKAYLSLLKKYHPDLYQGDKNYAQAQTQKLNMIYNVLKDENQRKIYDESAGLSTPKQIVESNEQKKTQQTESHSRRKADYDGGIFSGLKNRWANAFSYDYEEVNKSTKNAENKTQTNDKNTNKKIHKNNIKKQEKTTEQKSEFEEKQQKEKQKMTFYVLLIFGIIIGGLILLFLL